MKKDSELHFEESVLDDTQHHDFDYLELPTSRKAFLLVTGLVVIISSLVLGKIGFLNIFNRNFYEARASANISREINLPIYRALILDRFHEALAKNKSSFSAFLNVTELLIEKSDLEAVIDNAVNILKLDKSELLNLIREIDLEKTNWVTLARNITNEETIALKGLNNNAIRIVDDYQREYIDGSVFAHVIGYTGIGQGQSIVGKSGLEAQYDEMVRGTDGRYIFYQDALGKVVGEKIISEPEPSESLQVTIDADLQRYFYQRLKSGLEILGRDSGAGLAINPKTGEILAMVSLPSFDSNIFVDRSRSDERRQILDDKNEPLFNRTIAGAYSPGSAIKPLVALGALKEGVINPEAQIYSRGSLEIPNAYDPEHPSVFLDWKPHGWVDVHSALARSSNVYFYLVGGGLPQDIERNELVRGNYHDRGLGISKLNEYWRYFGFGKKTGVDLPSEVSGFLPDAEEKQSRTGDIWRLGDTYNVSIGQGDFLVNPLQLLAFIASVGNGGKIYKPFLKKGTPHEVLVDYSSLSSELREVQQGLEDAVSKSYGSSHSLASLPFLVAGKTGTPQIANRAKINAFFAGYAPAHDPDIAILVLVENAREGSLNALPIAKDIFRWYYENRLVASQ